MIFSLIKKNLKSKLFKEYNIFIMPENIKIFMQKIYFKK